MEIKKCQIESCEREIIVKNLCSLHYYRFKSGNLNISPNRLGAWIKRPDNSKRKCAVPECKSYIYAKGLCHKHYAVALRNGFNEGLPIYRITSKTGTKCSVAGCNEIASGRKGFCKFHRMRNHAGVDLARPKGNKGELNPRWNGGISEYPNHYEMKKTRKEVLQEANYKCHYCGKKANEIHHLDLSKDNHKKENFVACCKKCNANHRKPITDSKYRRMFGKTLTEMAKEEGVSVPTLSARLKSNLLIFKDGVFRIREHEKSYTL